MACIVRSPDMYFIITSNFMTDSTLSHYQCRSITGCIIDMYIDTVTKANSGDYSIGECYQWFSHWYCLYPRVTDRQSNTWYYTLQDIHEEVVDEYYCICTVDTTVWDSLGGNKLLPSAPASTTQKHPKLSITEAGLQFSLTTTRVHYPPSNSNAT